MPLKKNMDSAEFVRRSSRPHSRTKEKSFDQQEPGSPVVKRPRGRPRTVLREQQESPIHVSPPPKTDDHRAEEYCWLCHEQWPVDKDNDKKCKTCQRVYHHLCLRPTQRFTEDGRYCPECRHRTTDGTETSSVFTGNILTRLLNHVFKQISDLAPDFKSWTHTAEEKRKCVRMMDLDILLDRLHKVPSVYTTTAKFFADVKWIYHNTCIVHGPQHKLTKKAKELVTHCKNELNDIDACPECYFKSLIEAQESSIEAFTEACSPPHTLVWAKVKGYPYWPAKVLKVIDGMANVRFFGTHDKSKIPISNCQELSEESPTGNKGRDKDGYAQALKELKQYITNIIEKNGTFQFGTKQTAFKPGSSNFITKSAPKRPHVVSDSSTGHGKPRRGRPPKSKKSLEASNMNGERVDESSDATESENDTSYVEIIESSGTGFNKSNFLKNLELSGKSSSRPPQWENIAGGSESASCKILNLDSQEYAQGNLNIPSLSSSHVEMDFVIDDRDEEDNCSNLIERLGNESAAQKRPEGPSLDKDSSVDQVVVPSSLENSSVTTTTENILSIEESNSNLNSQESDLEIVYSDTTNINTNPNLDENIQSSCGYNNMFLMPNNVGGINLCNVPFPLEKYMGKIMSTVQATMQEMCDDLLHVPEALHKKIEELEKLNSKYEKKALDMKENTDIVIKKMKERLKIEKMKAVEEAKLSLEEERQKEKVEWEAKLQKARLEEQEKFKIEMARRINDLTTKLEAEKKAVQEASKICLEQTVSEKVQAALAESNTEWSKILDHAKKNQWDVCAVMVRRLLHH